MEDGRLPFRYEGARRLCQLEDVLKLKAIEEKQAKTLRDLAQMDQIDYQPAPDL
jgi:hypothetical protein